MRHNSLVSRERASEAAAATQTAAATAGGATAPSAGGSVGGGPVSATTTATGGATSGSGAASANTNSNSSASSSTVAAAQAAVYSGGNTVTGSLGSGGVVARGFRSHSPTHRRRSRERQRRTHGSDQGGLLAYSGLVGVNDMTDFLGPQQGGGGGGGGGGGSAGTGSGLEDSRLSGNEDYYSSFVSDEFDSSKKVHRRCHERSSSVQAIDRLNTKIQCTKESIRQEQTARDDNVNEYLKLAASADKQQLQRIKAVFEKKNQKSAHNISQLQKKLDNYTKRAKDLQNHQFQTKSQHRQPREVLRDVGQGLRNVGGNIRDGITGFSGSVMSKPREFAHLIKNKFGSADNINQMSEAELQGIQSANADVLGNERLQQVPGAGTSTGSGGGGQNNNTGGAGSGTGKFNSDNGSECSSVTSESIPGGSGKSQSGASQYHIVLKTLLTELAERKAENEKLKERIERLETGQKEFNNLTATLESERYRAEGLEEQINDLTELHQNEIENLKQTIADMEEKVQYQSDERLRDVNEVLENCQTRISKMEHMSQQQYVTVEGIDNSNARALVVKLINVVLTILQVVLLLVATAAGIIMPFLKTRVRVLTTFLSICFVIFVIRQWPDVQDIGSGLVRHLKQSLVVK
ncbi:transmembrane and coiled-coil domains protein 2 isoform X2 [Drosophila eugracilis]|uniref:transmembrane and coiled-coil domains protein 2 isoform X2 n=1 Tax=Drosophila eugracilis TaxID=29029 RepID=UPI001BDA06A8|nr:transmembrane and coiled-coil domains protein 2 isoform X2 [Drosophila eugracilis]XP_017073682.2 transmembrane and coiled-coil domains protein 2 isoform X2 [Drosophila eugracilis]XP_017073683.2 transmembrane and coiled-coil domains protein 2 isoform X2 [Drosophila eugracilis]XP_017073684.2 transmembrane and coiled-coil domains protein 2 isoform X2 [Drosophila eugracilis]XP_017073685.2 transmembrane and coiled-coil domains protein 2 isoform X2 [Drosophila eugracilis]